MNRQKSDSFREATGTATGTSGSSPVARRLFCACTVSMHGRSTFELDMGATCDVQGHLGREDEDEDEGGWGLAMKEHGGGATRQGVN